MLFHELNSENFLLFAIKNYENPQAVTREDFDRDLNHFKYIRSCLKTFVVFLGKLPEFPHTYIHDLEMDDNCLRELISFHNEQ